MNFKNTTIILILTLFSNLLLAQNKSKGDFLIGFSIGPSFANFRKSEAPHKINIYHSDEYPAKLWVNDITQSVAYTDYKTNLVKDVILGISMKLDLEFFMKNNFSISSGIAFENKGINLNYYNSRIGNLEGIDNGNIIEIYNQKIANNYFTIPIICRKYFTPSKNIYFEVGFNSSYLLSSEISNYTEKTVFKIYSDGGYQGFKYSSSMEKEKDVERDYSNKFDYSLAFGTGFTKNISNKLTLKTGLRFSYGLRKVDAKYNNEYGFKELPSASGFFLQGRATNYFGFNSNAKNIFLDFTVGLSYKIGK